jgi:hypothetical protein
MTIYEVISSIRTFLKEFSDDSNYEDEFLYMEALVVRNKLLERELKKNTDKLTHRHWKPICMPLCLDTYYDCDCIPEMNQCKVLKSKYKIPSYFTFGNFIGIDITSIDGYKKYDMEQPSSGKYKKFRKTISPPYWYINDGYLYIFNVPQNIWEYVTVRLIPENPMDLASIPNCDTAGNVNGVCYDPYKDDFGLPAHLYDSLLKMVCEKLGTTLRIKTDETNNAESETAR